MYKIIFINLQIKFKKKSNIFIIIPEKYTLSYIITELIYTYHM